MMPDLFERSESNPIRLRIDEQIAVVSHEVATRETLYSKWVKAGKCSKALAEKRIAEMRAVLVTLQWIRDNEGLIRWVAKREGGSDAD